MIDNETVWNTHSDGTPVTLEDAQEYERQLHLFGIEKFEAKEAKKEASEQAVFKPLLQAWLGPVEAVITELMQKQLSKPKNMPKKKWWKVYSKLSTHRLAVIAMSITLDATQKGWTRAKTEEELGMAVGRELFRVTMEKTSQGRKKLASLNQRAMDKGGNNIGNRRKEFDEYARKYGYDHDLWVVNKSLPPHVESEAKKNTGLHGSPLLACLMDERALGHIFKNEKHKKEKDANLTNYIEIVELEGEDKSVLEDQLAEIRALLHRSSSHRGPMILPPNEWGKHYIGPYKTAELNFGTTLIRGASMEQQKAIEQGREDGTSFQLEQAVSHIQETPYRVNNYVYKAFKWAVSNIGQDGVNPIGRKIGGFPNTQIIPWDERDRIPKDEFEKMPVRDQVAQARRWNNKRRHNKSATQAVGSFQRVLGEASRVMKYDRFWLPHNLDYRGRVYHIPDFGHHSADYQRALFEFANRKVVDEDSELFIKLQLANTAGKDKKTLKERMQWVDDNEHKIIAAGTRFSDLKPQWEKTDDDGNPVIDKSTGEVVMESPFDFWASQDKSSFQFLAACRDWKEYKEAQEFGEPYKSGLPIAMDATQSGVQHYSAATLTKKEGKKVNLLQLDRPADFYSRCLARAIGLIEDDLKVNKADQEANPISPKEQQRIDEHELLMNINPYQDEYSDEAVAGLSEAEVRAIKDDAIERWTAAKTKAKKSFAKLKASEKQKRDKDIRAAEIALGLYKNPITDEQGNVLVKYGRAQMKRNAMTFCYSAAEYGFADQLNDDWMKKLTDLVYEGKLKSHPFGDDEGFHASTYLAAKHYEAIRKEVPQASKAMDFFVDVTKVLLNDKVEVFDEEEGAVGKHVRFDNRINFPFVQNYREFSKKRGTNMVMCVRTELQDWDTKKQREFKLKTNKVSRRESLNGIAPNIIHSQDSLHQLLTVLDIANEGVTDFMGIHDSFAVPAADAQTLARSIRKMFILMYKDYNLLEDFLEQAKARHSDPDSVDWPPVPKQGDLVIEDVWHSDYFFS